MTRWSRRWRSHFSRERRILPTWSITIRRQVEFSLLLSFYCQHADRNEWKFCMQKCSAKSNVQYKSYILSKFTHFYGACLCQWKTNPHSWTEIQSDISNFSWPLQAGEENPVVHLSVVSLNGPLHTVVMKKPDDPRIGWVTARRCLIESTKNSCSEFLKGSCDRGGQCPRPLLFPGRSITSPWWSGPPAPNWLWTGWTEHRTTPSWPCVRLRLESA